MKARLLAKCLGVLVFVVAPAAAMATASQCSARTIVVHPVHAHVTHYHVIHTRTFTLAGDARIHFGSDKSASLADLRTGEIAHISYTVENGLWLAHKIVVNPVAKTNPAINGGHPTTNGELHARGAIVSYNAAAGIITIR